MTITCYMFAYCVFYYTIIYFNSFDFVEELIFCFKISRICIGCIAHRSHLSMIYEENENSTSCAVMQTEIFLLTNE